MALLLHKWLARYSLRLRSPALLAQFRQFDALSEEEWAQCLRERLRSASHGGAVAADDLNELDAALSPFYSAVWRCRYPQRALLPAVAARAPQPEPDALRGVAESLLRLLRDIENATPQLGRLAALVRAVARDAPSLGASAAPVFTRTLRAAAFAVEAKLEREVLLCGADLSQLARARSFVQAVAEFALCETLALLASELRFAPPRAPALPAEARDAVRSCPPVRAAETAVASATRAPGAQSDSEKESPKYQRLFDDWKDEHRRGSGYMGKSC